jgi:hypothetical protein
MIVIMPWDVPSYLWHHWLEIAVVFAGGYATAFYRKTLR